MKSCKLRQAADFNICLHIGSCEINVSILKVNMLGFIKGNYNGNVNTVQSFYIEDLT